LPKFHQIHCESCEIKKIVFTAKQLYLFTCPLVPIRSSLILLFTRNRISFLLYVPLVQLVHTEYGIDKNIFRSLFTMALFFIKGKEMVTIAIFLRFG
jgi:hypothetical protein